MATAEEIQAQMRQMRCELGEDVEGLVENASVMSDWRYYVRSYPWACLGVAAAAGFLLVPSRPVVLQQDPGAVANELAKRKLVVNPATQVQAKAPPGVLAAVAGIVANTLLQGGLALAKAKLGEYMQQQMHRPDGTAAATRPARRET